MEKTEQTRLPAIVTDYIDAAIKTMRYRKKIQQEVREELTAHFADALAGCTSDEQRNTLAKAIIIDFGDVRLLGKLMRRAKKRCRPLWQTAVVRMFQAVGVLFVLLLLYVGWFFTGKPIITTNYLDVMNRQVRPVAEDSQNAWPYYKQAADRYVDCADKEFDNSPRNLSMLTPKDRQVLQEWIADNQKSLDLVRQGNQKPYYWQVYETGSESEDVTSMIDVLLPHLSTYRHLTRLYCWQAMAAAEKGDMRQAFDSTFEAYSFGQHIRGQNTTLIEQLVAIAIEGSSTGTMRLLLKEYPQSIDAEMIKAIRERFGEIVSNEHYEVSLGGEKVFIYDEIQRCFTQTRLGNSHLYLQRVGKYWLGFEGYEETTKTMFHLLFTHPDREQTLAAADRFYNALEEIMRQTPASLHTQQIDVNARIDEIAGQNLLLKFMSPALDKVIQISYRNQVDSAATLTLLATFQYQKMQGVWPASLEVLVQEGLLDELPMDSFADAPLVYKKTGDGFTLYSVGLNFTDDGGIAGTDNEGKPKNPWGENGDAVFWPVPVIKQ